jgi:hypothetical protein
MKGNQLHKSVTRGNQRIVTQVHGKELGSTGNARFEHASFRRLHGKSANESRRGDEIAEMVSPLEMSEAETWAIK